MTFGDYLFLGFLVAVFLGFGHLLAKQDKERQKAYKQGFFDACNCKRPDCHLFYNDNYLAHSPTGDEDFDDLAGYTYPYERTKLYKAMSRLCIGFSSLFSAPLRSLGQSGIG